MKNDARIPRSTNRFLIAAAMVLGAMVMSPIMASAHDDQPAVPPVPAGYDKYMLFVADGSYDFMSPDPDPNITGCGQGSPFCDGDYFHKVLMHRSDEDMRNEEVGVKALFVERFGIDVDAPANQGRVQFRTYMLDPRLNYHVVTGSGLSVPAAGWRVRDGGWAAIVIDPSGFDLGGGMAGMHVPVGSLVVVGDYNIQETGPHRWGDIRHRSNPIVLRYQSTCPQEPGDKAFQCEVIDPELGSGLVRGRQELISQSNGLTRINAVNFISFPGYSKLFQ